MLRTTIEEYTAAVKHCLAIAQQPTHGGRVMAQVVLSAYNGDSFQLDVASMGTLDREHFEQALILIRGRYDTGIEPHSVIPDGSAVFRALWDQWMRLDVEYRGLPSCDVCEGRGRVYVNPDDDNCTKTRPCTVCNGIGRAARKYL
jgi:hypothetical protein